MSEAMTRREFVRLGACAGVAVAAGGIAGCGPRADDAASVETPRFEFGKGSSMGKRAFVGYATRTGSTVGVAEAIGAVLGERGYEVVVAPLKERPSLEGYDLAVLGSAINGGQWLPEALSFVEANRSRLGAMSVAAFCVHIMNASDDEKATKKRLAYLDAVRKLVKPDGEGFFLGKGPTAQDSSLIMRWAFKAFGGSGEGDCRDWDAIRAWATGLAA